MARPKTGVARLCVAQMRYHIDNPVPAGGLTFRAITQITGHTYDERGLVTGTRHKELIALLVDGPSGKIALGPDGQRLTKPQMKSLRKDLPEIDPAFG